MKLFRDRSLKRLSIYLLTTLILIFVSEYFIVRYLVHTVDSVEYQRDFARNAQLETQQVALLIEKFLYEDERVSVEVAAKADMLDRQLTLLAEGGRIDNTTLFVEPLSRLPKISYDNLLEVWNNYRGAASKLLVSAKDTTVTELPVDSSATAVTSTIPNPNLKTLKLRTKSLHVNLVEWYNKLLADLDDENEAKQAALKKGLAGITIVNIILGIASFFLFRQRVIAPVNELSKQVSERAAITNLPADELGNLGGEVNALLRQLNDATEFVTTIGEGKLDATYKTGTGQSNDKLADSLVAMQSKLKTLNEEEKKRQWANEGLTRFVDILRSSDDNITKLGDDIIAALVRYTHSNQGGLYVLNDEDDNNKFLEAVALFAFDTKKFEKQKVKLGEGILGQTFLEKETTSLTEVPDDYVRISSGLGDAGPKAILIVPLKVDQKVYGIVELAAFREYEAHEIAFVEKLGETIASTLSSVKAAQKNKMLIEQFQQQTEEMRAQEEEMRQNMEELTATQEEMSRKERDYVERIRELEGETLETARANTQLQETQTELDTLRKHYQAKVEDLEKKRFEEPQRADDWAIAEEMAKTLSAHVETLRITQEELNRKTGKN